MDLSPLPTYRHCSKLPYAFSGRHPLPGRQDQRLPVEISRARPQSFPSQEALALLLGSLTRKRKSWKTFNSFGEPYDDSSRTPNFTLVCHTLSQVSKLHTPSILSFSGGIGLVLRKPYKEVTSEEHRKWGAGRLSMHLGNPMTLVEHYISSQCATLPAKISCTPHQSPPCNIAMAWSPTKRAHT